MPPHSNLLRIARVSACSHQLYLHMSPIPTFSTLWQPVFDGRKRTTLQPSKLTCQQCPKKPRHATRHCQPEKHMTALRCGRLCPHPQKTTCPTDSVDTCVGHSVSAQSNFGHMSNFRHEAQSLNLDDDFSRGCVDPPIHTIFPYERRAWSSFSPNSSSSCFLCFSKSVHSLDPRDACFVSCFDFCVWSHSVHEFLPHFGSRWPLENRIRVRLIKLHSLRRFRTRSCVQLHHKHALPPVHRNPLASARTRNAGIVH